MLRVASARIKQSSLARNSLWMFIGYGIRVLAQGIYFIIIARLLGPDKFGLFVSIIALTSILMQFSDLGSGHVMIQRTAINGNIEKNMGNALFITIVSGTGLVILMLFLSIFLIPNNVSIYLILIFSLSDILFSRIVYVCGQAFQALNDLRWTSWFEIIFSSSRLVSAILFYLIVSNPSLDNWGYFYLLSSSISTFISVFLVFKKIGKPKVDFCNLGNIVKKGVFFSIGQASQTINNDIDKTMLSKLSDLMSTGIYAAAYRVIDVAVTPIRAIVHASYSNFFKQGSQGIVGSYKYAKRLFPISMLISLIIGIMVFMSAPLLPFFLGKEYIDSIKAIQYLSVIPLIRTFQYLFANTLTGGGYQWIRSIIQILIALLNVLFNIILIPIYSWRGAVYSSIISDLMLLLLLWFVTILIVRRRMDLGSEI